MIAEEGLRDRNGRDAHRDLSADRARALALTPVSRETADRLDRFVDLLLSWQQRINLIASSTEAQCGRATSPTRCSSWRSLRRRASGSISVRAAGFPAW